jgi:hypothetical protein
VVLAAVFQERLLPHAADTPLAIAGRAATAMAEQLLTPSHVRLWSPQSLRDLLAQSRQGEKQQQQQQQQQQQSLPAAGFISDLFEGFRDPLDTLRAFALTVQPGSPLLLSCRPGDGAFASRPTLGTCTADGFLQLLCRAGLTPAVKNYGAWGRIAYTRAALAEGHYISFRTYLPRVAEGVVRFVEAEGREEVPAGMAEGFARELQTTESLEGMVSRGGSDMAKALEALAAHVMDDVAGEAAFSWAAVVFAIVEGWTLPLTPHYALNDTALWHSAA